MNGKGFNPAALVGGICILIGFFVLPWYTVEASGAISASINATGYQLFTGEMSVTYGEVTQTVSTPAGVHVDYPGWVMVGGFFVILGSFGLGRKTSLIFILIGAILAMVSTVWGFTAIVTGETTLSYGGYTAYATASWGFGLIVCLIGGGFGLFGGIGAISDLIKETKIPRKPAPAPTMPLAAPPTVPPPPSPSRPIKISYTLTDLEGEVLDYLDKHGGEISIPKASKELGLSEARLKATIDKLKEKGCIE